MIDRSFIGVETPEFPVEIEKGRIRQFAAAIMESNPVYFDETAARAAGHPALPAPPTFGFTIGILHPRPFDFEAMGVRLERILHAEQKFVYSAPIYAGDVIRVRGRITDMYEKKGGKLKFIATTTIARNQHDQVVLEMTSLVACRGEA
jgi:acyl dehydratase